MAPEPELAPRFDPVPVEPVLPKPQEAKPEGKVTAPVTPKPEQAPERPIVVVPPQFTQHTVQKGETFDSIARKYFGPKAKGSIIANANPMVDPKRLMPGRVLQVPKDPNNIQGVPVKPKTDPGTSPGAPVAMEEYVVQEGDTLSSIAQEVYGESRLWDVIYQANRDQLPRENALKIGQKLKVPPKPAR
jgi:nucleoid-associated protein YgaU